MSDKVTFFKKSSFPVYVRPIFIFGKIHLNPDVAKVRGDSIESTKAPLHKPSKKTSDKESSKMNELLRDYRDYLHDQDRSEKTIRAYITDLRVFAEWFQSATSEPLLPENLTPLDIADYRNAMLQQGKKPSTINRSLISISSLCQWAQQEGRIPSNPAEGIRSVAEEPLGPRALERKEQLALLRTVRKSGKIRDLTIVSLFLHTGIRVSELCNLRINDIAVSKNRNMINIREGKGAKQRIVPLNSTAVNILKEYIESLNADKSARFSAAALNESRFLFYGQKRQPLTTRGVRHLIKKYAYETKLKHVSPHVLRHTCAKNLIDAGQPIDRVAKILGHSNISTTSIYTMPTERDLQSTVESISWN
jgi:site-specific recombinase XerD